MAVEVGDLKDGKESLFSSIRFWFRSGGWKNPAFFGSLLAISLGLTMAIFKFGVIAALLFIAFLMAIPLIFSFVRFPKFGIAVLLVSAFFLFFVLRLGVNFPIGTLMDAMEGLLIISTLLMFRTHPDWDIFKNPIGLWVGIWAIYTILQVVNPAAASILAWLYTVRTVGTVTLMYFVFCYHIDSIAYLRLLVGLWLSLALIGALYALKQEYIGFSDREYQELISDPLRVSLLFIDGHWRKYSIFSDPVAFSYNMVMAFFICISLIRYRQKFTKLVFYLLAGGICFYAMFFSGTRGAYVLIPAGLVLFFILRYNKRILWMAGIASMVLVVLIKIPTANPTLYRFQTAFEPSHDASFNVRKLNQKMIQPFIQSHPFGGGLGATGVWGVRFAPDSFLAGFPPDSGYLRVAVEQGWIGLLLFCLMVFFILKTGIDHYFLIRNKELKSYCLAMTVIVFILGIGNYPQEAVVQFPSNILFFLAAAIIQVVKKIDDNTYRHPLNDA